jgi:hypothetical protein
MMNSKELTIPTFGVGNAGCAVALSLRSDRDAVDSRVERVWGDLEPNVDWA